MELGLQIAHIEHVSLILRSSIAIDMKFLADDCVKVHHSHRVQNNDYITMPAFIEFEQESENQTLSTRARTYVLS